MTWRLLDRVRFATATAGTGPLAVGAALMGFQTPVQAGALNGDIFNYVIEDTGGAWEIGEGTYSSAGPTLARTTIIASSNAGAAISCSGNAVVTMTLPSSSMVATRNGEHYSGPFAGMRNKIINGDFRIDQRYNHASSNTVNGYFADRWVVGQSPATVYYCSCPATTGFPGFTHAALAAAAGVYVPAAGDALNMGQRIEGLNIAELQWGTANAKAVTLSFMAWSTLAGTYGGAIINGANNRSYPFTYNIPLANTATYCSVTIPGDVAGTWAVDNTVGMYVAWDLGSGANYRGTAGVWSGTLYIGVTGTVQLSTPATQSLYITGVQLEVGSIATPFERRLVGAEMTLCQRYFQNHANAGSFFMAAYASTGGASVAMPFSLPTVMRATPTVSFNTTWSFNNVAAINTYVSNTTITYLLTPSGPPIWISALSPSGATAGTWVNAEL
jgi:hypothetical protein